jgi:hypothetical protein
MEQLAARRAHNPKVAGSSPAPAISIGPPLGWSFFCPVCRTRNGGPARILGAQIGKDADLGPQAPVGNRQDADDQRECPAPAISIGPPLGWSFFCPVRRTRNGGPARILGAQIGKDADLGPQAPVGIRQDADDQRECPAPAISIGPPLGWSFFCPVCRTRNGGPARILGAQIGKDADLGPQAPVGIRQDADDQRECPAPAISIGPPLGWSFFCPVCRTRNGGPARILGAQIGKDADLGPQAPVGIRQDADDQRECPAQAHSTG